eukprot:760795-Hanusia_phi.AAC.2
MHQRQPGGQARLHGLLQVRESLGNCAAFFSNLEFSSLPPHLLTGSSVGISSLVSKISTTSPPISAPSTSLPTHTSASLTGTALCLKVSEDDGAGGAGGQGDNEHVSGFGQHDHPPRESEFEHRKLRAELDSCDLAAMGGIAQASLRTTLDVSLTSRALRAWQSSLEFLLPQDL